LILPSPVFDFTNQTSIGFGILPYAHMFVALLAIMRYYVVFKGRNPGVYETWAECCEQVSGYKDAMHQSFSTYDQAWDAFKKHFTVAVADGIEPVIVSPVTRRVIVSLVAHF